MIKESTASTFVVCREHTQWRLALVWHPRLGSYLPAGGQVENDESAAEAALREVREETGLQARLLPGPVPGLALPAGFPHQPVPAPWWTVEMRANADGHTPIDHFHVDHVFVAVTDTSKPIALAECAVRWFSLAELAQDADIAEDSRLQAKHVLAYLDELELSGGIM